MQRTPAMRVYVLAYMVVFAALVVFLLNVLGAVRLLAMQGNADRNGPALALATFGVVMLLAIASAATWSNAPRRPWFWLVGTIPGLLFFLPAIPIIILTLALTGSTVVTFLVLVFFASFVALLVSAVMSFLDARRLRLGHR